MAWRQLPLFTAALAAVLICVPVLAAQSMADASGATAHILTLWREGDAGERLEIRGRVMDARGELVEGAQVRIRQVDASGDYVASYQGEMVTNARGEYVLRSVVPGNYGRPKHIHVAASHPQAGYAYTEILFKGDPLLAPDDVEHAIALETVRIGGKEHKVGTFDIVLGR